MSSGPAQSSDLSPRPCLRGKCLGRVGGPGNEPVLPPSRPGRSHVLSVCLCGWGKCLGDVYVVCDIHVHMCICGVYYCVLCVRCESYCVCVWCVSDLCVCVVCVWYMVCMSVCLCVWCCLMCMFVWCVWYVSVCVCVSGVCVWVVWVVCVACISVFGRMHRSMCNYLQLIRSQGDSTRRAPPTEGRTGVPEHPRIVQ